MPDTTHAPLPWSAVEGCTGNFVRDAKGDLVAEALRSMGRPVILVGHSFGGRVATCIAADHPELVDSMVLVGVPLLRLRRSRPSFAMRVAKRLNRLGLYSDDRLNRMREERGSADYRAATGTMRQILVRLVNEEYDAEMPKVARVRGLVHVSDSITQM